MAERVKDRIEQVMRRMADAARCAGRDPGEVELVAVTKTVPVPRIREAVDAGVTTLGENRVQEAADKITLLSSLPVRWHLIGHLQTNKSRPAAELFELIHSLDSVKLAAALDRHGAALAKQVRVLIEVNLEGEPSKTGILEQDLLPLLQACQQYTHLAIEGLMAIPPFRRNPQDVRPFFRKLRLLRDQAARACPEYPLRHLSMGMSHDYEIAIEEGATLVRVGTAIFEARPQG
ncbi:MAG: YggS family pyridoxal phosphate-dependent enzyme [candidate division NC10 bacterium]|nr:YggS family pyridoxal phosphate-dependent enzyme [candidate division NC10 bacterium]MDE2322616.1 YggS family pyridoxal phosphate-dependent enzyme [candidate division NC10 bacterium]